MRKANGNEIPNEMLKAILHSKRANLYYLEHCRVLVNGGRVEYVTEQQNKSLYWNIPIANTTAILLGTGTSVTQAAMREFARAGVLVGFCGGGGTPLFAANEKEIEISWMNSQSEYRPTEYLQNWCKFWFDDQKRLLAAKKFQFVRVEQILKYWLNPSFWRDLPKFSLNQEELTSTLNGYLEGVERSNRINDVLTQEALLTRRLYHMIAKGSGYGDFTRSKKGEGFDAANRFLDHGNYLAYGLAGTACWVLGLPHALAVLHGKTRRGGLVFDVADLIKDAIVMPQAFLSSMQGSEENNFRLDLLSHFRKADVLDTMIDTLKSVSFELA